MPLSWQNLGSFDPRTYVCGYCGDKVGPDRGYYDNASSRIYICGSCRQPTYFDDGDRQWPGVAFGSAVAGLPAEVGGLYDEARRCMSVAAYTAAVMACRKLLMNIGV